MDQPSNVTYEASIEREIVLTRVFDAPRNKVFEAWVGDDISWFGPDGFTCVTHERDVRIGGVWRFDLVAPDGQVYTNRVLYREVAAPTRLVFEHGSDVDDDPDRFLVTVTFDEQTDGKTVLTLRNLLPTVEQRAIKIDFGAVELGLQTMAKLEAHLNA